MKNLCGFSVFHCVEKPFDASSGDTPKMKNGAPRDEPKNGRGRGWVVPYFSLSFFGLFEKPRKTPKNIKDLPDPVNP